MNITMSHVAAQRAHDVPSETPPSNATDEILRRLREISESLDKTGALAGATADRLFGAEPTDKETGAPLPIRSGAFGEIADVLDLLRDRASALLIQVGRLTQV